MNYDADTLFLAALFRITSSIKVLKHFKHGRRKRGDGGDAAPAVEKSAGDVPPETMIFQYLVLLTHKFLHFPPLSK